MSKLKLHYSRIFLLLIIGGIAILTLSFQNCAPGFNVLKDGATQSSSVSDVQGDIPDDPSAPLSIYIRNLEVKQGNDLVFKIELNKVSDRPVVVQLEPVNDTALNGTDFGFFVKHEAVTIPAGELNAFVSIPSMVYSISKTEKRMKLRAKSASHGAIVQSEGVGVIKPTQLISQYKQVVAGNFFTCAITMTDTVQCWGHNVYGQLGVGTYIDLPTPTDVPGLSDVKMLSASEHSICAMTKTGTVSCWGASVTGVGGSQVEQSSPLPRLVAGVTGAKQISVGYLHGCAIAMDDTVLCWGGNGSGQLGTGNYESSYLRAVQVSGLSAVTRIDASTLGMCAAKSDGKTFCWGYRNNSSNVPIDSAELAGARQIVEYAHQCFIAADEKVKCRGGNYFGQLGNGTTSDVATTTFSEVPGLVGIKQISVGSYHTCALTAQKTVKCWGYNSQGQLGDVRSSASMLAPVLQTLVPLDVPGVADVKQLISAIDRTCVVTELNVLKCWGANAYDSLGDSSGGTTRSLIPLDVAGYEFATFVDVQYANACISTANGQASCLGGNYFGQLGNGTTGESIVPQQVQDLLTYSKVVTGRSHACAISGNSLKCWGFNAFGQLGSGRAEYSLPYPVTVSNLTGVKDVAIGQRHTCALMNDGTVKCWGNNSSGELGLGDTTNRTLPETVVGLTGIKQIVAEGARTCVVTATDLVKCWGENINGAGADSISSNVPFEMPGLGGIKQVSIGNHNCAVTLTGAVKCWGANSDGQLGNGTKATSTVPVQVIGLTSGVQQVSVGTSHSCALLAAGVVRCWGSNRAGELGINSLNGSLVPVEMTNVPPARSIHAGYGVTYVHLAASSGNTLNSGRVRRTGYVRNYSFVPIEVTRAAP